MENRYENRYTDTYEIYFEKKFRIFYTIDRVNHVVYIEAINHKDEC